MVAATAPGTTEGLARGDSTVEIAAIGVPQCDDYIRKFSECLDSHVPKGEAGGHRRVLREQIGSWKKTLAGNREVAAEALKIGCRAALESAKVETSDWSCRW